jgi:hypothetical protein
MKQLEVTQLWNKTQHQLRADEFQIPHLTTSPVRWWQPQGTTLKNLNPNDVQLK